MYRKVNICCYLIKYSFLWVKRRMCAIIYEINQKVVHTMQAVITVIGKDKVGILAEVAKQCAEHNANVVDVEQTIMQDYFTMIMLVNIDDLSVEFEEFQRNTKESIPEMEIHVMHEDIFNSMHQI